MISIAELSVDFGGVRPIDGLTVDLDAMVHGVIGPNGAGKTTLLNVVSGFTPPSGGSIVIDSIDVFELSADQRARWGMRRTFQTEQLVDRLSVFDNVLVMAETSLPRPARHDASMAAIEFVGLPSASVAAGSLNSLERRLAELARALVGGPKVVLMDEPASGLVGHETEQFGALVQRIPVELGAQVVLVEHDLDLVSTVCERVAVLDFGRLLAQGPTATVLAEPAVRAAWLGEALT
ncbi:MAG: ATP-binding cassette domain-containing protein [Ilumatobacteraceae bacterium]|nr:ABC transporter ATP-binding protein [Acidimicrobiales bacterium]MCB9395797.1 ABC transporter ATP-binding protein [Acidimicrobiaceae bacterium]